MDDVLKRLDELEREKTGNGTVTVADLRRLLTPAASAPATEAPASSPSSSTSTSTSNA